MNIYTVAIGRQYHIEAERLKRCLPQTNVFKEDHPLYDRLHEDNLLNGLSHKCNFANYIDEVDWPVVFIDADAFSLEENPLETFEVNEDTDIAFVPYSWTWHFPDAKRQEAFDFFGYKINSWFMRF